VRTTLRPSWPSSRPVVTTRKRRVVCRRSPRYDTHESGRVDRSASGAIHGRGRGSARKTVPGISAEIVLTVDGELRKTRLFRFTRAGGTGRRDCGRADDLRWKGVGVIVAGASALGSLRASGHESLFRLPATWILRGGSSRKTSGTCCGSCREGASQASVSGQGHADHAC
jgi:hypothetical protein